MASKSNPISEWIKTEMLKVRSAQEKELEIEEWKKSFPAEKNKQAETRRNKWLKLPQH